MSSVSASQPAAPHPSLLKSGAPLWSAIVIGCLCSTMVVMDGAIVNVALPAMAADLGLSVIGQQWVIDAYLIALGGFMLLSARLGDLYGRRRVLQLGLTLFTAASLVGGLAGDGASLLAARAVQGLGASVLATSTLAVIASAYPKGKARDRAIGYWTASGSMAAAFGVLLGGVLTAYAGWRWVMFVNVPVGLVLLAMTAATLSAPERGGERPVLDIAGAVTVTGASACLVYALAESVALGWDAREVLEYLVGALALGLLFVAIEMGARQPLVRLGIFRLRKVAIGNLMLMGLGATLTSSLFFLSIALHQISGYGARDTGLAMLPMCLAIAATALGARALRERNVPHLPLLGGLIAAAGLVWLGFLPAQADYLNDVLGPTLLVGCGAGLLIASAVHAAIAGIPPADTGLASGLLNTSRQLGGALGIAGFVALAHVVAGRNGGSASAEAAMLAGHHAAFFATGLVSALTGLLSLMLRHDQS